MNHHTNALIVSTILDERRRQAPPRRPDSIRTGRLLRRAGSTLVAAGSALTATGRRLQDPSPGSACATC